MGSLTQIAVIIFPGRKFCRAGSCFMSFQYTKYDHTPHHTHEAHYYRFEELLGFFEFYGLRDRQL
jgi:hypothetical protein